MIELIDTHCHIHFSDYGLDPDKVLKEATKEGIGHVICVGCTLEDSRLGVEFASTRNNVSASIGIHPHEAEAYVHDRNKQQLFCSLLGNPKIVAIGECGLDYHYMHASKSAQSIMLEMQLDLASTHNLPCIFHVRDAFDDFWKIKDKYPDVGGVVHSFTSNIHEVENIVKRKLSIGLNGIMTFSKDPEHSEMVRAIPLDYLVVETDAPFLTPTPFRGTICQPKHVWTTANFLATKRHENIADFAAQTTANARRLFNVN
ncbi:MAG: hypothetical protein NVSMB46_04560 [Candidatus Saccharimonadales bacterium]